jgi:hypothetical protein
MLDLTCYELEKLRASNADKAALNLPARTGLNLKE